MPTIFDNIENILTTELSATLSEAYRADFCVGYFNLRGWKEVVDKIDLLKGGKVVENKGEVELHRYCRLLVGMQKLPLDLLKEKYSKTEEHLLDQADAVKLKKKLAQEFKEQLTIGTPSEIDEITLRKLSQQLKEKKVVVKLHLRYPLHAKLYLTYRNDRKTPTIGYLGSSNLTLAGLSKQGELNIDVVDDPTVKLVKWFEDRWDDKWCLDISEELIEVIDNSWAADKLVPPYHVYLKVAYHLSQEARAGLSEFKIPKVFRDVLLPFQQAAVLIAAKKLHKRDGIMIGDVVGLGKTITACAIAKLFEEDFFYSSLIICPPNLKRMWTDYINQWDLKANVISVGEVQKRLPDLRRYKLVIIDESHNLRNDQGSRYRAIKSYLEENESKVILLSATPYNKSYLDLSNQLRLFISDDKDLGIMPERYIEAVGGQVQFLANHTETFIRSIKAFEWSEFTDDWRELMRLYLIRRTRSFIKDNYAETDPATGRKYLTFFDGTRSYFPERIPKRIEYPFDADDPKDQYAKLYSSKVVDIINKLEVPRYGLGNFISKHPPFKPTDDEAVIISNLSKAGKRLMGFCRTNLFKRLESSGYSFLLSLSRHVMRNAVFLHAIENNRPLPIGKNIAENLDDYIEDKDTDDGSEENYLRLLLDPEKYLERGEEIYNMYRSTKLRDRFEWIRSELFSEVLQESLIKDNKAILSILKIGKNWDPQKDRKLNALHDLLTKKHAKEKVLVFTQFADTADYLTEQLEKRGVTKIVSVTGDNDDPTSLAHRFSPVSNKRPEIVQMKQDLRILISTDVLSEGQNLQDAHIIVNYDLPWAIIRLIQRAGRIDRIGQKAEQILCYSFLPEDGIEQIINLRRRLRNRIKQNSEVVGSDEVFFDGDPVNITDLYNEKAGVLDDDEGDTEVDLASYAYQIWKNATDDDPALKKTIPEMSNVVYSTMKNKEGADNEGVVVYARTAEENDVLTWIDSQGKIITNSQLTILKALHCTADTQPQYKLEKHHELVHKGVDHIRQEEKSIVSSLGKKTSVKYRSYTRLKNYCDENEGTLFVTDALKKAVDDILNYTMKEFARDLIGRQLKAGISDEELGSLVISLREEDKLCIVDNDELPYREPQIICSMGLKNTK